MNIGQMTGGRDLGPAGSLSLKELFSTLYNNEEHDGLSLEPPHMWSLRLKSDGESDENGDEDERILDESRMITGIFTHNRTCTYNFPQKIIVISFIVV